MLEYIISSLAPHHCVACGDEGSLLCSVCQEQSVEGTSPCCVWCSKPTQRAWQCCSRNNKIDGLWCAAMYNGAVAELIHRYKFERARRGVVPLAELLDAALPYFPGNAVAVPIPTSSVHVRVRGYDHTLLLAEQFAKLRKLQVVSILRRQHNAKQVGADRATRKIQAAKAFMLATPKVSGTYILIDDVTTTGATLSAAAKLLHASGAQTVYAATVAHQPLKN